MAELIDVINENNEVIDTVEYDKIYKDKLNHRIVHILVINPTTKEIYFQKRAETKSFLPGYYCTSAGGHVQSGETYTQAAKRELKEEIGLNSEIQKIDEFIFEDNNHKRFIRLYLSYAEGGFNFEDGEVQSGEFLSLEKAKQLIEKNEKIHPQLKVCFERYLTFLNK